MVLGGEGEERWIHDLVMRVCIGSRAILPGVSTVGVR